MSGTSNLKDRFLKLTFINILSNITIPLVGLVDTAMLGHLGDIRFLAGVALAVILFDYVYWTFGFLRMGTTGTTAQAIGRDDLKGAHHVLYRSLVLALGIAAALLILQWPLRELGFLLLAGEPGVEQAGRAYFNARIWGAPATLCNFAFLGWYLGREESHNALIMTVVGNLANILFNYIFIIRLQMAAYGAGLATMVSQYLMLAVALVILMRVRQSIPWRWHEVLHRGELSALFRLNGDILIRTLCLITSFAIFTNFSSLLGTVILAANTILIRLLTLAAYLIDGAAFASESLAGVFRGAGDIPALRRLFRLSLLAGLGFALLFLTALFISPDLYYRILTSHTEVIGTAATYDIWLWPTLLFGSLAYMYDGLFLGLTAGRTLRRSMMFSTLVVFLPPAIIAVYLQNNHLLWGSLAFFMIARAATLGWAGRSYLMEN